MAMSEQIKQKRIILQEMSRQAKKLREKKVNEALENGDNETAMLWASKTLNSIIIDMFYKVDDNVEFKTFHDWKKENKKVRKGERGFVIWGKPLKAQGKEEKEKEPNEENGEFFPICHLFSNKQVELLEA